MKVLSLLSATLLLSLPAQGIVTVTITGGNGSALSVTLPNDVTFENVTTGVQFYGFVLYGSAPGNTITDNARFTGDMGWNEPSTASGESNLGTFNTNPATTVTTGSVSAMWRLNGDQPLTSSTMTLTAGTITTTRGVGGIVAQGEAQYSMVMVSSSGAVISDAGVQIPEPGTVAAGLGALALGVAGLRRWRKQKAA